MARMNVDPSAAFRQDIARRVGTRRRPSASTATKFIVANPGAQAVLLLVPRRPFRVPATTDSHPAWRCSISERRVRNSWSTVGLVLNGWCGIRKWVVIGRGAAIRENCTLLHRVTLGERFGDGTDAGRVYPHLGARVVVCAGAVIVGGVRVGDDAVIGANAVVLRDVAAADVVVGVPARSTKKAADAGTSPARSAQR
jgi:hypothetical protein